MARRATRRSREPKRGPPATVPGVASDHRPAPNGCPARACDLGDARAPPAKPRPRRRWRCRQLPSSVASAPAISLTMRPREKTRMRSLRPMSSIRSEATRMTAALAFRQGANAPIEFELGGDVDTARRVLEDEHLRRPRGPSSEHDLLLIAAREICDALLARRRLDREAFDGVCSDLALPGGGTTPSPAQE